MDELLALSSAALPPHLMTDVRGVLDAANTVQTLRRVVRAEQAAIVDAHRAAGVAAAAAFADACRRLTHAPPPDALASADRQEVDAAAAVRQLWTRRRAECAVHAKGPTDTPPASIAALEAAIADFNDRLTALDSKVSDLGDDKLRLPWQLRYAAESDWTASGSKVRPRVAGVWAVKLYEFRITVTAA